MKNVNQLYAEMLGEIYFKGETIHSRGMLAKEIRNYIFVLENPFDNVITLEHVATRLDYAKEELEWYLAGTDRIDFSPLIKKVWRKYTDDGIHANSAYGYRMFGNHPDFIDQWNWVIEELQRDRDSRRAVINLNYPGDKLNPETKDFVCTMFIQVFIRNNRLEWTVVMRSNDAYYGFRNDLYCFTSLQEMMATALYVDVGRYTHIAGSMHIYEKDFPKIELLIDEGIIKKRGEIAVVEYDIAMLRRVLDRKYYDREGNVKL